MTATDPTTPDTSAAAFGANSWLVEEMYERFCADPSSVGEHWREFFDGYQSIAPAPSAVTPSAPSAPAAAHSSQEAAQAPTTAAPAAGDPAGEPIRGAGLAIATNMERSLSVPTATSFRNIPAKLL